MRCCENHVLEQGRKWKGIGSMKLLIGMSAYNEMHRVRPVIDKLREKQPLFGCDVVLGDDGSTDGTYEFLCEVARDYGWGLIHHENNQGVGAMIRDIITYGKEKGYDVVVGISANGKTDIDALPKLFKPVMNGEYDYVKGSRYLKGGKTENMPLFRLIAIPIFSTMVTIMMFHRISDVSFLVNASRLSIYDDPDINLNQAWLDTYGLEYYILYYVIKKKYRMKEVPMTIHYPEDRMNYSKIKPFSGWWLMVRPWFLLRFGIKK